MSTPVNNPNADSDSRIKNVPESSSYLSCDALTAGTSTNQSASPPLVCLYLVAGSTATGAFIGSIYGYGSGLIKKKGLKGSFAEMGSNAKSFAIMNGVHSLVECILERLRGKHDVINAGVAGCCTGLALSFPGSPKALLESCVTIGVLSYIFEFFDKKQQRAHALPSASAGSKRRHFDVLPPLAIPLPNELKESFSSFCTSLRK